MMGDNPFAKLNKFYRNHLVADLADGGLDPFTIDLNFVSELDTSKASETLRKQFQEHGENFTSEARIVVEQAGSKWTI